MFNPLAVLQSLGRPAAIVAADGEVTTNAAFEALPAAERARALSDSPGPSWQVQSSDGDERLVVAQSRITPRISGRDRALATLSHEIRTPLNGVLGMAALLADTRLDPTQNSYLAALRDSGEHLLGLVNDVLDFAKLEAGRPQLECAPTDLARLLQGVCELLSPRAYSAGIDIAWAVDPDLPKIMADDGRLKQILFNLAGNAVKMTKSGGVLISAERRGGDDERVRVRLSVEDTGPGLSPDAQERVFGEFVQTEAGVRAGGTGLGLAIVKRLAEAFEGQVGVDSIPGEGAVFWFEAQFAAAGSVEVERPLEGLDVAIVTTSEIVREAAARQVAAAGGRVLAYRTLVDAARSAPEGTVLLLDPRVQGKAKIPSCPPGRQVLVMLAPEARGLIPRYRDAGYAGYLIKPLRPTSLVERVLAVREAASAAAAAGPPEVVEDDRIALDAQAGLRVLLAEDNAVNALLARALLAHSGCSVDRVSSGEEALEAVAAAPYDVILMDVRMPVMDGLTAVRALRARGVMTPVIALTANAFEEDRRACLEAGMNDFLTKPLEAGALRAALARWTDHTGVAKLAS